MKDDQFNQEKFKSYLRSNLISKIHYFTNIDSTNSFLKNLPTLQNGELAITETQSAGRGRRGRVWKDEPYQNLLFSLSYKLQNLSDLFTIIPLISALSIAKTIQNYLENVEVKWPNDIKVNGKKIAGILVESKFNGNESVFIIGIGLNINQSEFDLEIRDISTSFFHEKKEKFDREKILAEIIDCLVINLNKLESKEIDSILYDYSSICSTLNKKISFDHQHETKTGFAVSIQRDGALLIKSGESEISYHGNEIFHIR